MHSATAQIEPGTRVVVTGASGFIGGRLTELLLELGADVMCFVRGGGISERLAHSGARFHTIDLADAAQLRLALDGVAIVFHCAYDWNDEPWNIAAIRALIEAARAARCARLVHLSSFVVYQLPQTGEITENSPADTSTAGYAYTKREIEAELLRAAAAREDALPVAILQPTIVYGARSRPWTIDPANELLRGDVLLPESGDGICNAVYVDDVVQAMLRAARHDGARGKRFLISGPAPITWTAFYAGMARELGVAGPQYISAAEIASEQSRMRKLQRLLADPKRIVRRLARGRRARQVVDLAKKLLRRGRAGARNGTTGGSPPAAAIAPAAGSKKPYVDMPNFRRLGFLQKAATVHSERARREIGYDPQFDYDAGIAATAPFLHELRRVTLPVETTVS
jgi:nucleoside-diphosphate-sugar epimerase